MLEALATAALAVLATLGVFVIALLFWEALGVAEALAVLARLIMRFAPALGVASLVPVATSGAGAPSSQTSGGTPGDLGSLAKGLLEIAQQAKLKLQAPPRLMGDELVVLLAPIEQDKEPRAPVIDVVLGNVRVCGLPAAARPIVDALAQIGVAVGAGAFQEFLGKKTSQA